MIKIIIIFIFVIVKIALMEMSGLYKVRLVQSPLEQTAEVCFSNLRVLIENSLWSLNDAKVVCTQLGYGAEGTQVH